MPRDLHKYEQDYAASPFEETMAAIRKDALLAFLAQHRFHNILEVGCGEKPLFAALDNFTSFTVVEPGLAFFQKAQAAAQDHKLSDRIHVFNQAFENFQPTLAPDFIIISSLLHELADPRSLLEHAFKVAPAGGWLHVNVPNARSFHRLWAKEAGLIKDEYQKSATQIRMQQNRTFDLEGLSSLVSECGFSIAESGSYFIKPFTHAQMQRLMELGILTNDLLNGLARMERHLPGLGAEIFVTARK
jgi:SAM-dependent methyltransferase